MQYCADLCKKPETVKAIYIYASESSHYALSENDMIYRGWATDKEILAIKISKNVVSAEILHNSLTSNPNIDETVSHSIINNTFSESA